MKNHLRNTGPGTGRTQVSAEQQKTVSAKDVKPIHQRSGLQERAENTMVQQHLRLQRRFDRTEHDGSDYLL